MSAAIDSKSFAEKAIAFFSSLKLELPKESGIDVLNPYKNESTQKCVKQFFEKYFSDHRKRIFLFGINPGRHGSGLTGVSFTDPVALRTFCGIENQMGMKRELSSEFIYQVIEAFGGSEKFYRDFFMSAICPLGFMKGAVNYNYYDDKKLQEAVTPFIHKTFQQQIDIGAKKDVLICIGTGKNKKFMEELNRQIPFFEKIIALEHPRFIMQYRRKELRNYTDVYLETLSNAAFGR